MREFLQHKLSRYDEDRNQPQEDATSGLSPYLHFGHLAVHQIFVETMEQDGWSPGKLAESQRQRRGCWGASPQVESFLDELITWREVGYNLCWQCYDYDQYESLPDWARKTLAEHAGDRCAYSTPWTSSNRPPRTIRSGTPLNANWSAKAVSTITCECCGQKRSWNGRPGAGWLDVMIQLNNKYALDGRDPNSYSGIFWVLGRYDRAWGPNVPFTARFVT